MTKPKLNIMARSHLEQFETTFFQIEGHEVGSHLDMGWKIPHSLYVSFCLYDLCVVLWRKDRVGILLHCFDNSL